MIVVNTELKTLVFGEWVDNFTALNDLKDWIGIDRETNDDNIDEIGTERLGSTDLITRYGLTNIILVGLLIFCVVLTVLGWVFCFSCGRKGGWCREKL